MSLFVMMDRAIQTNFDFIGNNTEFSSILFIAVIWVVSFVIYFRRRMVADNPNSTIVDIICSVILACLATAVLLVLLLFYPIVVSIIIAIVPFYILNAVIKRKKVQAQLAEQERQRKINPNAF